MVIKYKSYIGPVIYINQINGTIFRFRIKDIDDTIIDFTTDMNEIRIVDCPANTKILLEINRGGNKNEN